MKKPKDIPTRIKKLEEELRSLRSELESERLSQLQQLPDPFEALMGSVGDLYVAIPLLSVREVLPRVFLQEMPESPSYLAGYLNWRGVAVPVIDPAARWGDSRMPVRLEDRIIVFNSGENPRGLLLSEVEQIARVSHSQLGAIPPEISAGAYALAMWYSGDRNVLLISPDRLVDPSELSRYETA